MKHSLNQRQQESSPPTARASAVEAVPVSITGAGVCCLTGSEPFALFGAVATRLSGARSHACLEAPLPGKKEPAPLLYAPVPDLQGLQTPHERIAALAQSALNAAAGQLSEKTAGDAILVLTMIPESSTPRGANLDPEKLRQDLAACHTRVSSAEFRFVDVDQGAVEALELVCAELREDKWQAVVFGGADSLVDTLTLFELVDRKDAMAQGSGEGVLPGEGAAYLVLEKQAATRARAQLDALSAAPEPHPGQAHDQQMTGMTSAIRCALQGAGITPEKLDCLVLPFNRTTADALEWHQVLEALWPRRENIARVFETLRPTTTLGDAGAAALPLGLALGCARFEFDYPPLNSLLVCANHPCASRGAVILRKAALPSEPR